MPAQKYPRVTKDEADAWLQSMSDFPSTHDAWAHHQRMARAVCADLLECQQQLADRKIIERAKGELMKRHHTTEDRAYDMMRKAAQDASTTIAKIAQQIVARYQT